MKESTAGNFLQLQITKSNLSLISDKFDDFVFSKQDGKNYVYISFDKKDLKQIMNGITEISYKEIVNKYAMASYMLDSRDFESIKKNKDLIDIYATKDTSSLFDVVIASGDIEYVKNIVELFDIDFSKIDETHMSPVITAIKIGDYEYYKKIVDMGWKSDIESIDGETPILVAYTLQKNEIFNELYASYTPSVTKKDGQGLIHFASIMGDKSILMNLLKEKNVDINQSNKVGQTPLFYAITGKHIDIIETLIKHGADVKHKSDKGINARELMKMTDKKLFKKLIKSTRNLQPVLHIK